MKKFKIEWIRCDWLDEDDFDDDEDDDEDDDGSESYQEKEREEHEKMGMLRGIMPGHERVIHTPFGIVSENDTSSPINDTEFFIAHVNFNLSRPRALAINDVEGVEFLKIISRYRFAVGMGVLFDSESVKLAIEKVLNAERKLSSIKIPNEEEEEEVSAEIQNVIDEILSQVKTDDKWVAYIFPHGKYLINVVKSDNELELRKEELMTKYASLSNGMVLSSND